MHRVDRAALRIAHAAALEGHGQLARAKERLEVEAAQPEAAVD